METWVAANPAQAAAWAASLPAGTFRDDALSALMFHWGDRSPADAAAWMARTGVDDPEAASVLASRWSAAAPTLAAAWAAALPPSEMRLQAAAAVAAAWAAADPPSAAAWAALLPAPERAAPLTAALAQWATSDPPAAAAWLALASFDSELDRAAAAAALITPWTDQSPAAAAKYLNSLPEGPAKEAAASQFAVAAAATAPAEALMWAMNLSDPTQRNQVVADACETWFDRDPEAFRGGIAEAIGLMDDPAMRQGVYQMLYERDPTFQTHLLQLVDRAPPADGAPPAASPASPSEDRPQSPSP